MKRFSVYLLSVLLLTALCVGLTACGGDDNGGGRDEKVVGTWIMDNATYNFSCGWQFNADGTCSFGEWSYKGTPRFPDANGVTWSTSGNTLRISAGPESASFTYSVSNDGKTLVLTATSSGDDYGEMAGTYTKR